MTSRMNTVLIIGATAGIGLAFTHRFHAMGKKVIATGRNERKLNRMAQELPGLETRQFDISDLAAIPANINGLLKDFPSLDTVFIMAGIQQSFNFFDASSTTPEKIAKEITTDLTAPALLMRLIAPHLLQLAGKGTQTTLFVTTSALAYTPISFYPTYCASKAGLQALVKILRQQLLLAPNGANMRIVDIVPPYVDTGLDKDHREFTITSQGGAEKAFPPMPLDEYVDKFFDSLEKPGPDGNIKKEIGAAAGETAVEAWHASFDGIYEAMGFQI
ncbi:NAD(P)-binding protein [Camillea tinctor]|nr:NAD(P)-binding protein [Camillea tinctor]